MEERFNLRFILNNGSIFVDANDFLNYVRPWLPVDAQNVIVDNIIKSKERLTKEISPAERKYDQRRND